MIKLTEVCELLNAASAPKRKYTLREIYINPEHIVSLHEASSYAQKLVEGQLPPGLDQRQRFTRLKLNQGHTGLDIVVVGSPDIIQNSLGREREVLHG
jgi:hypothetical protein